MEDLSLFLGDSISIRSGLYFQHLWWCREYHAIPSVCLSLHIRQLEDPSDESLWSTADCPIEVRDLSTLGFVAGLQVERLKPPHIRAPPRTLDSAMARVQSPPRTWTQSAAWGRKFLGSTVLGSTVAPGPHGPGRTLSPP
jgi:hypothetical protein